MKIDWFTAFAQIVNFLILVALLKRFLYQPIVKAMENRESRIAGQLEDARRIQEEAQAEIEGFRKRRRELEAEADQILETARKESDNLRRDLTRKVREEVNGLSEKWKEALAKEKELFLNDLSRQTGRQAGELARKALVDLASADMERAATGVFVRRLSGLDQAERDALRQSIRESKDLEIASAFELSETSRREIKNAIVEQFGNGVPVRFEVDPDLVFGVELASRDRRLAWNADRYLKQMEETFVRAMAENWRIKMDAEEKKADEQI